MSGDSEACLSERVRYPWCPDRDYVLCPSYTESPLLVCGATSPPYSFFGVYENISDIHDIFKEKALREIIKSNREILDLLNDIEEKRRLQAAPFQARSTKSLREAITQEENDTKDKTNLLDNQCQSLHTQASLADNTHGQTNDVHAPKANVANVAQSIGSKAVLAAPKLHGKTLYKHESDKNPKQTIIGPSRDHTKAEFAAGPDAQKHIESSNALSQKTEQTPERGPPSDGTSKGHQIINRDRSSTKTQYGQVKEEKSDNSNLHGHDSYNSGEEKTVQRHGANSSKEEIVGKNRTESSNVVHTLDSSDNTDETLIVQDLSVVLQDPLYVRNRDGFRRKKTSAAHDNRLLIYLNIKSSSKLDEKAEDKIGKRGNTELTELDASNKRHTKRLLIENKRATIHIDRWSDLANQEMKKGRIARELRHDGPDTIFCLDISSSMKGQAIVKAKWFIETHISELQVMTNTDGNYEHVALVTFGKQTKVHKHLTYEYFEILSALDSVRLEGPSPMYGGLKMCMAAILGAGKDGSSQTKIYLLTDGRVTLSEFVAGPDSCTEIEESREQERVMSYCIDLYQKYHLNIKTFGDCIQEQDRVMSYCIDLYQKYHLNINTVGVGDCNQSFLESIANNTGGEFIVINEESLQETTDEPSTLLTQCETSALELVPEDEYPLKNSLEVYEKERLEIEEIKRRMLEDRERMRHFRDGLPVPFPYTIEGPSSNDSSDNEDVGDSLPHVGARIRIKGNPLCGTVTQQLRNGVRIVWDRMSERGCHKEDISGRDTDCLEVVKEPRVLTNELIAVGCRVKRGPDWRYTDQDVYPGNQGTVIKVEDSGIVSVAWDNGPVYTYRYGADVKFEVELLPPAEPSLSHEAEVQGASNTTHIPESSVTEEKATSSQGNTSKGCHKWRWKDEEGRWNNFPDDVNDMIEESYHSNKKGSVHIILQDKQRTAVNLDQSTNE